MTARTRALPPKTIWAYAYQILPAQPAIRLRAVQALLDSAHSEARRGARTWNAKLVLEERITHILIVSDSPEQNHDVNRALESKLRELQAGYSITVPLEVEAEVVTPTIPAAFSD